MQQNEAIYLYSILHQLQILEEKLLDKLKQISESKSFNQLNEFYTKSTSNKDYVSVIEKADKYAQEVCYEYKEGDKHEQADKFEQLEGIFNQLEIEGTGAKEKKHFDLRPLSLSFREDLYKIGKEEEVFNKLCLLNMFVKEWKKIPFDPQHIKAYAETLLSLIYKYFAYYPSKIKGVALYDCIKLNAGLAVCLFNKEEGQEASFLLVGGAIPSIQQFIFNIISKNAAKNLKGRSFYVQLLLDILKTYILKKLNLFEGNVIYASGGKFYLLVPNNVVDKLEKIKGTIQENLYKEHGKTITFSLAYEHLSEATLKQNNLSSVWGSLSNKLERLKYRKYAHLLNKERGKEFFTPSDEGGEAERDPITNEELRKDAVDWGEEIVNRTTKEQIDLGKHLKSTIYLVQSFEKLNQKDGMMIEPAKLGVWIQLMDEKGYEKYVKASSHKKYVTVWKLNDTNFLGATIKSNCRYGFLFYGGNDAPQKAGEDGVKEFDELTGDEKLKFRRLGVLRMDVDNLGAIFTKALEGASIYHYTALSRNLDYFFKGYLNTLWKESSYKNYKEEFVKDHVQIIYAGGDDLFLVGKWNVLLYFARVIQQSFRKWVCQHPKITLSGGLVLVTPKFPIIKAAEMAGQAEKQAKDYRYFFDKENEDDNVPPEKKKFYKKNAFHFLNTTFNWDEEYPIVEDLQKKMRIYFQDGQGLSKAILMRIQAAYNEMDYYRQQGKKDYRWIWHLAYDLARAKKRYKNINVDLLKKQGFLNGENLDELLLDIRKFLDELKNNLVTNRNDHQCLNQDPSRTFIYLELANLAAKWTELELRDKTPKNN